MNVDSITGRKASSSIHLDLVRVTKTGSIRFKLTQRFHDCCPGKTPNMLPLSQMPVSPPSSPAGGQLTG